MHSVIQALSNFLILYLQQYIEKKKRIVKYADLKAKGQLPVPKKKLRIKKTRGYDKFRSVRMQKPGKIFIVSEHDAFDDKVKYESISHNNNGLHNIDCKL